MEKPPSLLSRTSSLNIEDTDFDWLRGYLLREHSKASGDLEILKDDNLTPQMLSGTKHRMSSVDLMASKVLPPDTPLWESPAQDEDDAADGDTGNKRRKKIGWTNTEDLAILAAVRRIGTQWPRIAAHLPGRTDRKSTRLNSSH